MKSVFYKDVMRSITHSLGRFLAIAGIVALGTGFYSGLRMTAPDMKLSADLFYDGTALMDARVLSTMGLTDDDLDSLRALDGVKAVMGAFETDVMATINDEQFAVRVHSLPDSALASDTSDGKKALSDDDAYINRPILVEGAWPQNSGECVLSADVVMGMPLQVGDKVVIKEGAGDVDKVLATRTYTITGLVSSSYYATSSNLGTTSLGSGTIQQVMFVPEDDFSADLPYTEAFLTVRGASDEFSSSAEYKALVDAVMAKIEALAPEREEARMNELRAEAQAQLDRARAEYEQQKADAEAQLAEAKTQLDNAAATIAQNEQDLAKGQLEYDVGVAELSQQQQAAEAQFADSQARISQGWAQLDAQKAQLDEATNKLKAAWEKLREQSAEQEQRWQAFRATTGGLYGQLDSIQSEIELSDNQLAALDKEDPTDPSIIEQKNQLNTERLGCEQCLQALKQSTEYITAEQTRLQLEEGDNNLAAQKTALGNQQTSLDQGRIALNNEMGKLEQSSQILRTTQNQTAEQFASAKRQLASAADRLENGRVQLTQGKADYETGLAEYKTASLDADERLSDAQAQLDSAQEAIDALERPVWYVMDRDQNYGVSSFEADANRVDSIASVFPFLFFLVAALVALTTMTRMVEEERVLIGTYKALGYGRWRIASKYLLYAALASIAGSVVGIAVLSQVLPAVIQKAYAIIYFVPQGPLPIDWGLAGLAAGMGVGVTLAATAIAIFATLRERPAQLMLPRAPKAGKRILLERVRPVWRRLSFSWKVTFRNLFRYKKRFVMTMVGIAGCTALLLTGLGLSDAINDIINKQFRGLMHYNATVVTDENMDEESRARIDEIMADRRYVEKSTSVTRDNVMAETPDGADVHVQMVVPEDSGTFDDFFLMRTREGHNPIDLGENGVVLAEKLATRLGVGVGDTVVFSEQDEIGNTTSLTHEFVVTDVMENYIYNYAFIGPRAYEASWNKAPEFESIFAVVTADEGLRAQFGEEIRAVDGVKTLAYNDETIEAYEDMLSSVNMIVVVLVVAAAALAFIVLYNLTNINITERQREIATLKVLGFTPYEVDAYIYRETLLLSVIGCLVGLVLGVFMESFVVVTAEVDQVMFGREIHPASFLLAFALTMLFAVLVMIAMRFKLARINMVESLKSNE